MRKISWIATLCLLSLAQRNVDSAGGLRSIYGLRDADWRLLKGGLRRQSLSLGRMLRKAELAVMPIERRGLRWRAAHALGRLRAAAGG